MLHEFYLVVDLGVVMSPRNQHHPSQEERDEKVKLDLPPDEALKLIMETGEHPEDEPEEQQQKDKS